ncbi:MAG: SpoIIE family protein phosphatase [Flavobacteriales bacterium]|nr:MAG: SpoIIE family protein phosphatase [Flavobacteriales bacterium]
MKKYFATTSRKVLLMLYGASLLIGVTVIFRSHRGEKEAMQEQTMARLAGVTGTLSAQLDGGRITRLLKTYDSRGMLVKNTQDAWYYVQHGDLQKSADAAGLTSPLVIVAYDAQKQELQTVVTSAERPELRNAYTGPAATEIRSYLQRNGNKPLRITRAGELIAIDAVTDAQGKVVAALVARSPLALLRTDTNAQLVREIGITGLLFAVIGLLLFRRVGRLVRHEEDERSNLQVRHDGITDSIAYAGKIQSALIPSPERFREQFDDFFVLNRPRDVVSGDFHWYHRISEHECLVAAADCTGHGLPGAMMAAIGCSLLNDLARDLQGHDPAELLGELNQRLISTLNQEGRRTGAGDGMDIALCRIDRKAKEILFAGAFRPLYWMHEGQLTVINGDRKPVGGSQHGTQRKFSVHRIAYHEGDNIYLFSDGYVDQFGGPDRKKFMAARFNEILLANHGLPMAMQAEALDRAFNEWKGTQPQLDDVCVLGIAV